MPYKLRVRKPQPFLQRPRRGRAPAHIPDPWADLEWERHRAAQEAVRSHPHGMTLEEIGSVMGITRERVRQIESSALRKLAANTGGDVIWVDRLTIPAQDCRKCGQPFIRRTGRQICCDACEATRRRKRPSSAEMHELAVAVAAR